MCKDNLVIIGQIIKPHGVSGKFKVLPLTDFVYERFSNLKSFFIVNKKNEIINYPVVSVSFTPRYVILEAGFTISDVESLRNQYIYIEKKDVFRLNEGRFYAFDLIDILVFNNQTNEQIGRIINVFNGIGNDVIEVLLEQSNKNKAKNSKTILVPFVKSFIKHIDIAGKKLFIEVMEGLL